MLLHTYLLLHFRETIIVLISNSRKRVEIEAGTIIHKATVVLDASKKLTPREHNKTYLCPVLYLMRVAEKKWLNLKLVSLE